MTEPVTPTERPIVIPDTIRAQPVAWWLLSIPAVLQFLLHVYTNGNYGIFRDEYYYMACANRPAWGYVDQPAFSIWILMIWKSIFGDSVHALRILPALCGSGLIFLCGATAAELGGRRWAQLFAGIAAGIGVAGLVICGFYSMNAYDLLFWSAVYFLVIRIARSGKATSWPMLGLVFGLGLSNKIGLLALGVALAPALLITRHRLHFTDRRLWMAAGVAVLFLLPYVVWNATNDWATVEFIRNAKQYKISGMSPLDFLIENIKMANPWTLIFWLAGLLWLLLARHGQYRIVSLTVVFSFVLFILQKSKPYYFAASIPVLLAAGSVAWEQWTRGKWVKWIRIVMVINLLVGAYVFAPLALPLKDPADLGKYMQNLGIVPKAQEVGERSELPQYFSDRLGWEELAKAVSNAYTNLPKNDQEVCIAVGNNYGHAGALEYWSKKYDMPPVYSPHNNYWLWGPPPGEGKVVIVVRSGREALELLFEEVTLVEEVRTPYAKDDDMRIWICRGLKQPMAELWKILKEFI